MSVRARPVFEYRGADSSGPTDIVGLWSFSQAPRAGGASFAVSGAATTDIPADEDAPVWRVELPSDYGLALSHLLAGEAKLIASQNALAVVAKNLESSAASTAVTAATDTSSNRVTDDMETLLGLLKVEPHGVSFGLRDEMAGRWESTQQQFIVFIERARQMIAHYAWVETIVGGNLSGRTVVSWTGDMTTAWRADPTTTLLGLHRRSLALALKSREVLIRILIVVAKGAVLISSGVGVLALPLAWKYVQEAMAEITAWRQMANEH